MQISYSSWRQPDELGAPSSSSQGGDDDDVGLSIAAVALNSFAAIHSHQREID